VILPFDPQRVACSTCKAIAGEPCVIRRQASDGRRWHLARADRAARLYRSEQTRWPGATILHGSGAWAVVSRCRRPEDQGPVRTVALYPTRAEASAARDRIDRLGCGGFCQLRHDVEELDEERTR